MKVERVDDYYASGVPRECDECGAPQADYRITLGANPAVKAEIVRLCAPCARKLYSQLYSQLYLVVHHPPTNEEIIREKTAPGPPPVGSSLEASSHALGDYMQKISFDVQQRQRQTRAQALDVACDLLADPDHDRMAVSALAGRAIALAKEFAYFLEKG